MREGGRRGATLRTPQSRRGFSPRCPTLLTPSAQRRSWTHGRTGRMGRTGASGDTGGSSSSLLAIRSPPPATPRRALALKSGMALFDPWLMLWFRQSGFFFSA